MKAGTYETVVKPAFQFTTQGKLPFYYRSVFQHCLFLTFPMAKEWEAKGQNQASNKIPLK